MFFQLVLQKNKVCRDLILPHSRSSSVRWVISNLSHRYLLQMRSILLSSTVLVLCVCSVLVSCQQDLPLWSGGQAAIPRELLRSLLLDAEDDYEAPASSSKTSSSSSSSFHGRQSGAPKKRVGKSLRSDQW